MSSKAELAQRITHWSSLRNNTARSWWGDAGLRHCMLNVLMLYLSIIAYGYDGALISTVQGLPFWLAHFNNPTGIKLGLITASYLIPQLPFAYLASWLSDRYGRKIIIAVASALGIVGPLVSGLGNNLGSFIGGRVITGISTSFYQVVAPPLIAEIAHPRFRAACQGSTYCTYAVGAFVVGWMGFGCAHWESNGSWRLVTIMQCFGSVPLLAFSVTPWMVESPRFLVKNGKEEQALRVLADMHANGDREDELVTYEMQEIVDGIQFEASVAKSSYKEFFSTPGNRLRLASLALFGWAISMAGNNVLAYYFPVVLATIGYTNFVQIEGILAGAFAFMVVCGLIGAQLADRIGRRPLVLISGFLTAASFTVFTALTASFVHHPTNGTAAGGVAMLYIFSGIYVFGFWPLTFLYLPEILPYHLRTVGMATYALMANLGALFNALVTPIALEAIGWKYYIVFVVGDFAMLIVAYFIVLETKGLTLEEIAILFDGEDAAMIRGQEVKQEQYQGEAISEDKGDFVHE